MKTISIISLTFIIIITFPQSRKDIEQERELYKKNKVKAETALIPENDINDNRIKTYFDTTGKRVEKQYLNVCGIMTKRKYYEYDKFDNLTNENVYIYENVRSAISDDESSCSHSYDKNNNRTMTYEYNNEINFIYDSNGILIESNEIYLDKYKSKVTYIYNEKGLVSSMTKVKHDDSKEITEFKYNTDGTISEKAIFNSDSLDRKIKYNYTLVFSYYKNGLLKEISDSGRTIVFYTYEFYE